MPWPGAMRIHVVIIIVDLTFAIHNGPPYNPVLRWSIRECGWSNDVCHTRGYIEAFPRVPGETAKQFSDPRLNTDCIGNGDAIQRVFNVYSIAS